MDDRIAIIFPHVPSEFGNLVTYCGLIAVFEYIFKSF